MQEGMLIGLVIVAVAQLPWLLWLLLREQPSGGGGGGTKRDDPPKAPPLEPQFDWDSFEDNFRAFTQDQATFGQYRPAKREDATSPSASIDDSSADPSRG
ncbi:MAG TPA: hypothetical protein VEM41_11825 [Actinomycetota bacterium]|nr:hypothetical protein [Actinomycetota bacterium]